MNALERDTIAVAHASHSRVQSTGVDVARVASIGLGVLVVAAPFEALTPLLRLPGQELSSVETVLLAVIGSMLLAWSAAAVRPRPPGVLVWPLATLALAAIVSAAGAGALAGSALHMAARLGLLAVVALVASATAPSPPSTQRVVHAAVLSGVVVALLVIADFAGVGAIEPVLAMFRDGVAVVGAQVRASGPFQYPTIASMYLEVTFALALGLLVNARRWPHRAGIMAALALMSEGIVLTFTRAGLLAAVLTMAIVAATRRRATGARRDLAMIVSLTIILALQVAASRSTEMLMLRLTTEGQGNWFSARIEPPETITIDNAHPVDVPLAITNTGRAIWDSDASEPVRLSYHWVSADSDDVVAWEGYRTAFDRPVRPGQTVRVRARVGGPGRPGRYRLMWDIEQERRLWFSTEPGAEAVFTSGTVTGQTSLTAPRTIGPRRIPRAQPRPGRLRLWGAAWRMFLAHPLLGVGPDNYRLLYGRYSTIVPADPRVHSNNMYLEILTGLGLVGMGAFAWLGMVLVRAARVAAALSPLGAGVAAGLAAVAAHGLVDSFLSFTATYVLIGVVIGLAVAMGQNRENHAHRV